MGCFLVTGLPGDLQETTGEADNCRVNRNFLDKRAGFTLVELLIVIVILAVLAAIAIPRFMSAGIRSKEASLKANLKLTRNAIQSFNADCGSYPATLDDLAATSAPATGLTSAASSRAISSSDWHGPYLSTVPFDPVSGSGLKYSATAPAVGTVGCATPGNDSDGVPYTSY